MAIAALQHARGRSPVHALHPLTKLFLVGSAWLTSLLAFNPLTLAVLVALALGFWRVARIPWRGFSRLLLAVSPIFVILTLINGFMFYNGRTEIVRLAGQAFTVEGVWFGVTISLKILSVVAFIPVLTFTTSMPRLMAALAMLRLPYKFIFTFGVAMRFTPLVAETFRDIVAAQRLRGYDIGVLPWPQRILRGYIPIFIPLVLSLLRRSAELDIAIESRAFGAPVRRTYLEELRFTGADVVVLAATILVLAGYVALNGAIPRVVDLTHV
jgi:energy-coupling factor transport system permease protein